MNVNMVLLAKSKKYSNYCVACYDKKNDKLVRLISNDSTIHHAVSPQDLIYEDGTEAEVGDVIKVEILKEKPIQFQPENLVFDNEYYLEKIATCRNFDEFLTCPEYIFFDCEKKISESTLFSKAHVNSLEFIKVNEALVRVHFWDNGPSVTLDFTYNNRQYNYFSVTDIKFKNQMIKNANGYNYTAYINDTYLLISLGEVYDFDNCRYKLIASVIMP